MNVLQINTVYGKGSVGRIAQGIHDACAEAGIACRTAFRFQEEQSYPDTLCTTSWLEGHIHNRLAWITGLQGCFSPLETRHFLKEIRQNSPDLLQLHNLHGSYLNWPQLSRYLKTAGIPIVWTLHDCMAFTGRCPFFTHSGCERWKSGCGSCPSLHEFPAAAVDLTHYEYRKKQAWFTGIPNLTLVTPSRWLAGLLPSSFLREYPVRVIPNGIDLGVFRPTPGDFRQKHAVGSRKLFLFVANVWEARKGPEAVCRFAQLDPKRYAVCVVGADEAFAATLPQGTILIPHTRNAAELAEIYTAADLFVNPTLEDNYPTVNMEALACGTPVLSYDTGGCGEIADASCGELIPRGDADALIQAALRIAENQPYPKEACLERAKSFDQKQRFRDYTELYRELAEQNKGKNP